MTKATELNLNKWDYINQKNCVLLDIAEWKKIFALNTSDKELICKIQKVLIKINPPQNSKNHQK